jgi:HEAT repeat protein
MPATKRKGLEEWYVPALIGAVLALLVACGWMVQHALWSPQNARLDDENPAVRAVAIRGFKGDRRRILDLLKDEDPDVRLLAACRVNDVEALIDLLKDDHAGIRKEAAWSLSFHGPDAWPALRKALENETPRVRAAAILALRYNRFHKDPPRYPSPKRGGFIPLLRKLSSDPDTEVRRNAENLLASIDR